MSESSQLREGRHIRRGGNAKIFLAFRAHLACDPIILCALNAVRVSMQQAASLRSSQRNCEKCRGSEDRVQTAIMKRLLHEMKVKMKRDVAF